MRPFRGARNSAASRRKWQAAALLLILALGWSGLAGAAEGPEPQTLALWNRPIVTFRATVAGNTPAQRAANARARIQALSDADRLQPIKSYEAKGANIEGVIVTVGQEAVFALLQGDVDPESGMTLAQLVERSKTRLAAV